MTRLLLFTNDYPYRAGDAVFVAKEIDALAAAFDDVVVFCHARDTSAGMMAMPDRVRLGGNLFAPAPEDALRGLLEWPAVRLFLQAAWQELLAGRLFRHPRLFLMGAKVGLTQAHRTAVREAIADADDVVAYGFWAMGGGLGVPWLQGVRARAVRAHGYDLYEERAALRYLPARPFLYQRADRVLAISENGARYIARRYPQARGRIFVSRLGVFGPESLHRPEQRWQTTIVSCSAVSDIKRVGKILDAVRDLAASIPQRSLRWVHFGDGPLMPALRAAVSDAVDGVTVELRGHVDNAEVLDFYGRERVDLFVNVSTTEGVPVSIMEAIAHGIPIVATDVGGTREIVGRRLRTGALVRADASTDEIVAAMREVLDAPADALAPRALWEREYDARITGVRAAELIRATTYGSHSATAEERGYSNGGAGP